MEGAFDEDILVVNDYSCLPCIAVVGVYIRQS